MFNYFYNGHVQTIYCYPFEPFGIMKAKVNPSQKSPDEAHTAWVIIHQTTAEVKVGHYDSKELSSLLKIITTSELLRTVFTTVLR